MSVQRIAVNNQTADIEHPVKAEEISSCDFAISDENYNSIVVFENGHIKTKNFNSLEDIIISSSDIEQADLNISDEHGNVLISFKNGHIKTKNFDSENISPEPVEGNILLDKFKNKKFALIGDSISTYIGWTPSDISGYDGATYRYYYGRSDIIVLPKYDMESVEYCYWFKLMRKLGLNPYTDMNNCAWSGSLVTGNSSSTSSAEAGCSTRRISDLSIRGYNPDIVLIYISCNDWGLNVGVGNWSVSSNIPAEGTINTLREAYALMIYKIQNRYPLARIFCCTILDDTKRDKVSGWPSNNQSGISTHEWNQNIIEIAEAFGCDVINLHDCGINYNNITSNYVVDEGLHPNRAGHELMCNKIFNELILKY